MAHHTIYGITTDGDYAEGGYGISPADFYEDGFMAYHYDASDYIDQAQDEETTGQLANLLSTGTHRPTVGRDEHWWYLTFDQETIDAYFQHMWEHFSLCLKDVEKMTAADMKDWYSRPLRNLNAVFSDDDGDMISEMNNGWMTPQEFMRHVKPGIKYYMCGALDAHS